MLTSRELANLRTIDRLNQRGGRMLSLLDLLAAGSLSLDMAAFLMQRVGQGASFLTAARPGGAGKTAVMGALLALAPPEAVLREIGAPAELTHPWPADETPVWHVCHELGAGRHFGYLWGEALPRYFELIGPASHVASNLHADTLEEVQAALREPPNHVTASALAGVDLVLTLRVTREGGARRHWVDELLVSDGQRHLPAYAWSPRPGEFVAREAAPAAGTLAAEREWLAETLAAGIREPGAFREALLRYQT